MSAANNSSDNNNGTEIATRLHGIRERLTRRFARPVPKKPELHLPPLAPLNDTRNWASTLAGSIGTVNPRPAGVINELIQTGKRSMAKLLDWIVRPQRDFNQTVVDAMTRTSTVLEATNRNIQALAEALQSFAEVQRAMGDELDSLHEESVILRAELHRRSDALSTQLDEKSNLLVGEVGNLRREFAAKAGSLSADFDEKIKLNRWAIDGALARQSTALQDRTFELLGDLQAQTGRAINAIQNEMWAAAGTIQEEMRLLRQRVASQSRAESVRLTGTGPAVRTASATSSQAGIDYFQLERHFRGTEAEIRTRQSFYLPFFEGRHNVLDIACGRGEFLELMREAKVTARGVDLNADMVGRCLEKGLDIVQADVFAYLDTIPNASLDGIFCAQFVEHLEPEAYVRLVTVCGEKLAAAGILAIETQNPECLAIFSQTFFLDPTHVKPIPPPLLRVLFAEAGLERIGTYSLSPATPGLPVIPQLASSVIEQEALGSWNAAVTRFNETFFGGMDYAVIGYRSASAAGSSQEKSAATPSAVVKEVKVEQATGRSS